MVAVSTPTQRAAVAQNVVPQFSCRYRCGIATLVSYPAAQHWSEVIVAARLRRDARAIACSSAAQMTPALEKQPTEECMKYSTLQLEWFRNADAVGINGGTSTYR